MKGVKYLSRASAYLFLYLYICVGFYAYFLTDCYVVNKGIPFALEHNQRKRCKYIYLCIYVWQWWLDAINNYAYIGRYLFLIRKERICIVTGLYNGRSISVAVISLSSVWYLPRRFHLMRPLAFGTIHLHIIRLLVPFVRPCIIS